MRVRAHVRVCACVHGGAGLKPGPDVDLDLALNYWPDLDLDLIHQMTI